MAWSYSEPLKGVGYVDQQHNMQLIWNRSWNITETVADEAGKIRLRVEVTTEKYQIWWNGQDASDSWDLYYEDSITCGGNKIIITESRPLRKNNVNYVTYVSVPNEWSGESVTIVVAGSTVNVSFDASRTYTLTSNAETGSTIVVSRAASNVGSTGSISSGSIVYESDSLIISGIPDANYRIKSLTVNNSPFTSGNAYTVVGDVVVVATAQILASDVGATDADIETTSTITIVRYDNSYVHTLEYSFGSLSGYITASGGTSTSRQIITGTSIPFAVPSVFYAQIPNAQTGLCTITCKTYASSTSTETLGDPTTCTFTARASANRCSPTVSEAVVDINPVTTALTQDSSKIVRYMSTARCTITAAARNSATLSELTINGHVLQNGATSIDLTGDELTNRSIRFTATDSREFTTVLDASVTLIPYVKLTCNPELKRNTPTDGNINLSITGKMYTGEWRSNTSNQLFIQYRYKKTSENAFPDEWTSAPGQYTENVSNSSYTLGPVALTRPSGDNGFDYREAYNFEIQVHDGDGTNVCSTVTATATVQQGIPVFDWGKTDFRFNVPIKLGSTQLTEEQLQSLLNGSSGGGGSVDISGKLDIDQGVLNAGKILIIGTDGLLVPKMQVEEITVATSGNVTQALDAGKIYHFTDASLSSLSLTLNAASSGQIAQYHFDFDSGTTATTLSMSGVTWQGGNPDIKANKHYEVDILNGYGVICEW